MFKKIHVITILLAMSLVFMPFANSFASQNMKHDGSCANCEHVLMPMGQGTEPTCSQGDCMDVSCSVSTTASTALQTSALLFGELFLDEIRPGSLLSLYQSHFIDHLIRPPII